MVTSLSSAILSMRADGRSVFPGHGPDDPAVHAVAYLLRQPSCARRISGEEGPMHARVVTNQIRAGENG